MHGLILAAPQTGSGKTTLTLALLRALRRQGRDMGSAKAGPDHIDPRFHEAASGRDCLNLDPWAMRGGTLAHLAGRLSAHDMVLVEGVMGLFDGASRPGARGTGSTADLARALGLPVLLVVNAAGLGASVAALVQGFARFDPDVPIAGLLVNNVGSARHRAILQAALAPLGLPVLGYVPREEALALPSRHLGLVQAEETEGLETFLERAADHVEAHADLGALAALAAPARPDPAPEAAGPAVPPLGQRIAVARDAAFRFAYPHVLDGWRAAGAEIAPFSPLADEAPDAAADAVYLPGGYPELHAGRLAANARLLAGLRAAAARGAHLYGECGGYMLLGTGLIDAEGAHHAMAGLLGLETSFAARRLHLGYRRVAVRGAGLEAMFRAHEFHYASIVAENGAPFARSLDEDAYHGLRAGTVAGSFLHLIDQAEETGSEVGASASIGATGAPS